MLDSCSLHSYVGLYSFGLEKAVTLNNKSLVMLISGLSRFVMLIKEVLLECSIINNVQSILEKYSKFNNILII